MRTQIQLRIMSRAALKRLAILFFALGAALVWCSCTMLNMPGKSYRGPLPPLTQPQSALAAELKRDVEILAGEIGPRSVLAPTGLAASVQFLERSLSEAGYAVSRQGYEVMGVECFNLIAEIKGATTPDEILIVGAHYDSEGDSDTPAANDNGSGVAATLALARRFAAFKTETPIARTVRFVMFVNEEPPFFQTPDMGSWVYAKACRARNENIIGMISLETIGYYSDEPGSQTYPIAPIGWMYPDRGDFIGFVGNYGSRKFLRSVAESFRNRAQFPSQGAALPGSITGVGWSDHWAFWQEGYQAIMVTDTAPFRYPHYHSRLDTPEKLDYDRMARVVEGMAAVALDLAAGNAEP